MHTLQWLNTWLSALRPLLETIFFIASAALVVIAWKGLEQLKIAKETAKMNAQREAYKLAAEECRNFALQVIPLAEALSAECKTQKLTCFDSANFKVLNGEITEPSFSMPLLQREIPKCAAPLLALLNALEAFSIYFVSRIAEESVAYRETGNAFRRLAKKYIPVIYLLRLAGGARYESIVQLYELWDARAQSEDLLKKQESIDLSLKGLEKKPITPIGMD